MKTTAEESIRKLHLLSAYGESGVLHILPYLTIYRILSSKYEYPFYKWGT